MAQIFRKMRLEEILIGLREVAATDSKYAPKAQGMMGWYAQKGDFTKKQKAFAANMISECLRRVQKAKEPKNYYLYAIDDGLYIKLGHTNDPKRRLKTMQTGQPNRLELLWTLPVGSSRTQAEKAERQLHRFCGRYKKRGEWFTKDCLILVKQFEQKTEADKLQREVETERAIVYEASQRI